MYNACVCEWDGFGNFQSLFKMVHLSYFLTASKLPFYLANNPKIVILTPFGAPMGKSILFHIHKHCTLYFTGFTQFLNLFYPKSSKFEAVKLGLILGRPPYRVDGAPIHIHKYCTTYFYKPTTYFTIFLNSFYLF